tara:strand:+ start:2292 stop:2603 length:312 start_codon:yes stop_codon:yes gene_type:complete
MTDQINALMDKLNAMRGQATIEPRANRRGTRRANDFAVWRAGRSVNWECTAAEIAADTRLTLTIVLKACKRRGWRLTHNNYNADRPAIDSIMAHPNMMSGGAT